MSAIDHSKQDVGRCAGESVTLTCDGEPMKEYIGTVNDEESAQ